jgi:oligoendopeptidase F
MMVDRLFLLDLPDSSAELATLSWEAIRKFYEDLATVALGSETIDRWLATWSHLDSLVSEAASSAMIAYTCDTEDAEKEAAHLRFSAEILPKVEEHGVRLARKWVESDLHPPGLETVLAKFRTAIELFREENVPLFSHLEELGATYQRITGGMTAEWEGRKIPLPQLGPHLQSSDRKVRETAFLASVAPFMAAKDQLTSLFDQMYTHRQRIAANAGFADFRDYVFPAKFRFDYTPDDCLRFHDAVEATVVPAVVRQLRERQSRLGLDQLRPWDLPLNPYQTEALKPFSSVSELIAGAHRVFGRVAPEFAEDFRIMQDEGLLDLESRQGKAPGGYCDTLQVRGRPFIFMNAAGVMNDVMTLLHEGGHAFHAFASHKQPLVWQRHPGAESAELASMSMELLASPYLVKPDGYLDEMDARRAMVDRLEDVLSSLAHIASVDAFQHWIYTSGEGGEGSARDDAWLRVRARFAPGVDWSGLERERASRWYRQLHIFLYPFYYIEYGIAQLGALQVWRNSLRDPTSAVKAYRTFLDFGATLPLPDLYRAAGASLVFDAARMGDLVALVEEQAAALREGLPTSEVASD